MRIFQQQLLTTQRTGERLSIRRWFGLAEIFFTLFIFAFAYKWIPGVRDFPIDLTIFFVAVTVVFSFLRLLETKIEIWQILLLLTVFLIVVLSFYSTDDNVDERALVSLYFLTIPAMVVPILLIRTGDQLRRLIAAIIGLIFLVSLYFLVVYLQGEALRLFLVTEGAQAIHPGRILGAQVILFTVLSLTKKVPIPLGLVVIGVSIVLQLNIGTRQGLFSAILTLCIWFIVLRGNQFRWPMLWISIVMAVAVVGFFPTQDIRLENTGLERYIRILSKGIEGDNSSQARLFLYERSIELIRDNPLGIGPHSFTVNNLLSYPHNFFLEAFVSFGWLGGVAISAILFFSLWRSYRLARKQGDRLIYTLFFLLYLHWFFLSNVSGDFNVNRILFAFIGIGISLDSNSYMGSLRKQRGETSSPGLQ